MSSRSEEPAPEGQSFQYVINTPGRLSSLAQFEDIIIKTSKGGSTLRLEDIARVELGAKTYNMKGEFKGDPTSIVGIYQIPGANALELAQAVRAKMEELSHNFPPGLKYSIPFDTTVFVKASIDEVVETLFIAVILVFITIFIFLQDWRATLIPGMTIPISLVGTFAVMGALGFSLNMLTLFGIVLAIGIVVDDAIVVVENSARNMDQEGLPPKQAVIKAMEEVSGPVIATTLVLLAVFLPTAFLGGISGELFKQFGITISVATVFSSINALTMSPAMAAILMRSGVQQKKNLFFRLFEKGFSGLSRGYNGLAGVAVRKALIMMVLFGGLAGATYFGFLGYAPVWRRYNILCFINPAFRL